MINNNILNSNILYVIPYNNYKNDIIKPIYCSPKYYKII